MDTINSIKTKNTQRFEARKKKLHEIGFHLHEISTQKNKIKVWEFFPCSPVHQTFESVQQILSVDIRHNRNNMEFNLCICTLRGEAVTTESKVESGRSVGLTELMNPQYIITFDESIRNIARKDVSNHEQTIN